MIEPIKKVMNNEDRTIGLIDSICQIVLAQEYPAYPGLMNGNGSIILFLAYYHKRIKQDERVFKKMEHLLYRVFEQFEDHNIPTSFATGYAGIGWLINKLIRLEIIDGNNDKIVQQIAEGVTTDALKEISKNQDFDHLYGLQGKYLFLKSSSFLNEEFDAEMRNAIEARFDFTTFNSMPSEEGRINIGLAHGIPSVGLFMLNNQLANLKTLDEIADFFVKTDEYQSHMKLNTRYAIFPNSVHIDEWSNKEIQSANSRYGWCYGDLGILFFLLKLTSQTEHAALRALVNRLVDSCNNRDMSTASVAFIEDVGCYDIGFCHGLSGILYLHHKINGFISDKTLLQKNEYWQGLLLDNLSIFLKNGNFRKSGKDSAYDSLGVLEGICGAGLTLMSYVSGDQSWDDCFMLNN